MIKPGKKQVIKKDQRRIRAEDQRKICGFTLIEMLVAVTIFTLVIGSVTGLFVSAVRSQAKALAAQKLLDETSYVMEYMGRALRMAKKELSAPACLSSDGFNYNNPGGDTSIIKFINYRDICQEFYLDGGRLKEDRNGVLFGELTSNKLEITFLEFNLSGEDQADSLQPRVTISITIEKAGATGPKTQLQTTISQRNLDIQ